jgi:hypothetical protein
MSQAAAALEAISDSGLFEQIATSVLRRARPALASVIHTGVNASGRTVVSPVDAIGVSAEFLAVIQHTTCAATELRRKWLGDQGDVAKAANILADERTRTPQTKLLLVLATNRVPDERLVRDVHALARAREVELDVWDRTRLADFLEHDPDGQWIGRKYLNLTQERLSRELLVELSQQSAAAFERSLLDDPSAWIQREIDSALRRTLYTQQVTFLVMHSGGGKSTAVSRLLRRHVDSNGFGLWLSPDAIEASASLESAVDFVLRQMMPTLEP